MLNRKLALVMLSTGMCVVACGTTDQKEYPNADIANVAKLKSDFGPEFKVSEVGKTGIDPKMLAPQTMPPGMKFEPPECSKFAEGQALPDDLKGNMAATSAEGAGNRFIVLAVETSSPIPANDPDDACKQVKFAGPGMRGQVEVVDAPQIDGAHTTGTHRIVQTVVGGKPRTGELYNYVARFGSFMVIVTANPLVQPNKPVVPVDTKKAQDLLSAAVGAVRG